MYYDNILCAGAIHQLTSCVGYSPMTTIFYSLSGEGRIHATRVGAVVEELRMSLAVNQTIVNAEFDLHWGSAKADTVSW